MSFDGEELRKSIEMPDYSQTDRIRKGDWVALNVDWGWTQKMTRPMQ